jgi:glycosyltransferase involved in cell wall biosynthesis
MKVAVVTPYHTEDLEILQRCHASVKAQTHKDVFHIMVADGHPRQEVDEWDVIHIKCPIAHGDYGDTPRSIGSLSALTLGADAICLLDADNWIEPNHVENLHNIQVKTGAQVVTATRMLRRMDASVLGVCNESNGRDFNDTNCYFFTRPAFSSIMHYVFKDKRHAIVGDRIVWNAVKSKYTLAHCIEPTINYVTSFALHYQAYGERPPEDSKVIVQFSEESHRRMVSFSVFEKLMANQTK